MWRGSYVIWVGWGWWGVLRSRGNDHWIATLHITLWGWNERTIQGNKGMLWSPVFSGIPIIKLRFCKAWPEAPFTRLSICDKHLTIIQMAKITNLTMFDRKYAQKQTYNRYNYCSSRNSIWEYIHKAVVWSSDMSSVRDFFIFQQNHKFFILDNWKVPKMLINSITT